MIRIKRCPRCGQEKALDADHFYRNIARRGGFNGWCIECCKKQEEIRRNKPESKARMAKYLKQRYETDEEFRERSKIHQKKYKDKLEQDPRFRSARSDYKRKFTYGLTPERFSAMLEKQGGKCAICENQFINNVSVDHDHTCCHKRRGCGNCVRGLLCARCNTRLGFKEDYEWSKKADAYLNEWLIVKKK
jgi:hypothetical protein